jgi:hypothetical protein
MLGCLLAGIGPEEALQSRTSQLLEDVSPSNVSFRVSPLDSLTGGSEAILKVDDGVRLFPCLLVKILVSSEIRY